MAHVNGESVAEVVGAGAPGKHLLGNVYRIFVYLLARISRKTGVNTNLFVYLLARMSRKTGVCTNQGTEKGDLMCPGGGRGGARERRERRGSGGSGRDGPPSTPHPEPETLKPRPQI